MKPARLEEFLGGQEVQRALEAPTHGRRRFVFFEVTYCVGEFARNDAWLGIQDTRYQFSDFILSGEERPFDYYTSTEVEALHTAVRAITSFANIL